MSDQPNPPANTPNPFNSDDRPAVSARVPEKVVRGVYCNAQVILDSPKEFIIDFLNSLTRPHQVVARVVMAPQTMAEFSRTFEQNLEMYRRNFGEPPPLPAPPTERKPTIQEIYDNFRLPDEQLSGAYANAVLIGHSPTEFFFDFITTFYPTSSVSARVLLPAAQAPKFLNTVNSALAAFQNRYQQRLTAEQINAPQPLPPPPPPPSPPPAGPGPQ